MMTGIYLSYEVISPHNTCSKVMLSAVKTILSFFWKQWKRSRVPPDSRHVTSMAATHCRGRTAAHRLTLFKGKIVYLLVYFV